MKSHPSFQGVFSLVLILCVSGCVESFDAKGRTATTAVSKVAGSKDQGSSSSKESPEAVEPAKTVPLPPIIVKVAEGKAGQIVITWQAQDNTQTGFDVSYSENEISWANLTKTGATEMTVTHSVLVSAPKLYTYRARAFNLVGVSDYSDPLSVKIVPPTLSCPPEFVKVLANPAVGAKSDFCVMKFEAKIDGQENGTQSFDPGFVPRSQATSTPWVYLTRDQAAGACQKLGSSYDLMTNIQWQALARSIEAVPGNWSGGAVGVGDLNMGVFFQSTSSAASQDTDPCFGTSRPTNCLENTGATTDFLFKRTHKLASGETIWDVSGNAWEWVKDDNVEPQGVQTYVSQMNASYDLVKWGPAGDFSAKNFNFLGGLGYAYLYPPGSGVQAGGIQRGGSFWNSAGIYSSMTFYAPTYVSGDVGFRCVFNANK